MFGPLWHTLTPAHSRPDWLSYERLWPTYNYNVTERYAQQCKNDRGCDAAVHYRNPSAPVHVVTGAAGCNEDDHRCLNPILASRGPWSAFWLQAQGTYSYVRITVHNSSALRLQVAVAEQERVVDDIWVHAGVHGPRSLS